MRVLSAQTHSTAYPLYTAPRHNVGQFSRCIVLLCNVEDLALSRHACNTAAALGKDRALLNNAHLTDLATNYVCGRQYTVTGSLFFLLMAFMLVHVKYTV